MKRIIFVLTLLCSIFTLNAKTLIVYYSYTNNIHTIVTELNSQIEADVLRIQPREKGLDYAANNYAIGSALIAAIRQNPNSASSYPAIDPVNVNLSDYDTVIIAAPLWWSNMAAPLQTFLFNYGNQMVDKNIGLIVSSASSGISGVESDAKRLVPGGNFLTPNLWIRSSQTSNCRTLVSNWLTNIDYANLSTGITAWNDDSSIQIIFTSDAIQIIGYFNSWSLYDIMGNRVSETTNATLNTNGLSSGTYIARINSDNQLVTRKLSLLTP